MSILEVKLDLFVLCYILINIIIVCPINPLGTSLPLAAIGIPGDC